MTICKTCNKEFFVRKKTQNYCSRKCCYVGISKGLTKPREIRKCLLCQKEFTVKVVEIKKYCSIECVHKSRIGSHITEEHKKIISETRQRDWANCKTYTNSTVGRTKWIDYVDKKGEVLRLQGSWEVLYAKYLDDNDIAYVAHKGAIWYTRNSDNTKRVYLPDFYLIDEDRYVDVKNDFLLKIDAQKIRDIKLCNPMIRLKIVTKKILINLGILKN